MEPAMIVVVSFYFRGPIDENRDCLRYWCVKDLTISWPCGDTVFQRKYASARWSNVVCYWIKVDQFENILYWVMKWISHENSLATVAIISFQKASQPLCTANHILNSSHLKRTWFLYEDVSAEMTKVTCVVTAIYTVDWVCWPYD